ncbi:MAG: hypothetical protein U0T80_12515 [Flavobacteriaceae bacterium]
MKRIFFIPAMLFIFMLNVASMCSSDDDSSPSSNPSTVINTVTQGTWRITYFFDTDSDETSNYSGYNFTFNSNGSVVAVGNGLSVTGTWSVVNDDTNDDNPSSDLDFNLLFSSPEIFAELSDDWDVLERTDTKIRLIDVSGGNGGTDYLTFEKN